MKNFIIIRVPLRPWRILDDKEFPRLVKLKVWFNFGSQTWMPVKVKRTGRFHQRQGSHSDENQYHHSPTLIWFLNIFTQIMQPEKIIGSCKVILRGLSSDRIWNDGYGNHKKVKDLQSKIGGFRKKCDIFWPI